MKRFIDVCFRLTVFAGMLGLTILIWGLIITGLLFVFTRSANADLPDVYIPHRWTCRTEAPKGEPLRIARGETQVLEITYLSYGQPVNLLSVYDVRLRYRSPDMPAETYHAVAGSVIGTNTVRIVWTPAAEAAAERYIFDVLLQGADSASLKAGGTITLTGHITGTVTNVPSIVSGIFDWGGVQHVGITNAPFANAADLVELWQADAAHTLAISNVTVLVGTGVAGVESNLTEHIGEQVIRDAGQDVAIAAAAAGANMNGDVTGQSSNAVVVATRGRTLPLANDVPGHLQAIVWSTNLNRYVHGSVDLSGINSSISNLQATTVSKTYVDFEISEVRGLVDGNDHVLSLTETFNSSDWLMIASNTWQHNTRGWMAYNATVTGGDLRLLPDTGYLVMGSLTQAVSRIVTTPSNLIWAAQFATNSSGPWYGYDAARDNIPATNVFAVRFVNTSGSQISFNDVMTYRWVYPDRVGFTRDFAGLRLQVDTPSGAFTREAANVQYVRTLAATGDISGTFAAGFRADKIANGVVNNASRSTGYGLIWYESVSEHRYIDLATQFELDAAVALKADLTAHNALVGRVTAVEGGGTAISGDVTGSHLQTTTVARIRGKVIDTPTVNQTTPVYDLAQNKIVWQSVLSSNLVYSAGTNDIANVPANAAAFYRAMNGTNSIMPMVLDQQIVGWFSRTGLTLPYGTLNLMESNLTANVQMYDGSAASPALRFLSDPTTGWYRAAANAWRFVAGGNLVADFGVTGITMQSGKTVTLQDGSRAVSLAEVTGGITLAEDDPLAIHRSSTTQSWTHAGGTYTTAQIVATSPVLSNGVASVTYALSGAMQAVVEMSDLTQTNWVAYSPFVAPGYVRVSLSDSMPPFGALDTAISNIVARSWTRPDLYGSTNDTAGQIIQVDTAVQARQPVPLAQMQSAIDLLSPAGWSAYPATGQVNLANQPLRMGSSWTLHEVSEGLYIASHGTPYMSFTAAGSSQSGLTIASATISNLTTTVGISTNGVVSDPMLQWTPSLIEIAWQTLTPESSTYPSTNAAGHYEIVAVLPASTGFVRAVQDAGTARADVHVPLYVQGNRVETGFVRAGTNLLWIADGITNRITMEVVQ